MAKVDLLCRQRSNFALRKKERGTDSAGGTSAEGAAVCTQHVECYQSSVSARGRRPKIACSQTGVLSVLSPKPALSVSPETGAQGLRGERGQTRGHLSCQVTSADPSAGHSYTRRTNCGARNGGPAFSPGPGQSWHHRAKQQAAPLRRVEPCPKATGARLVPRPQKELRTKVTSETD